MFFFHFVTNLACLRMTAAGGGGVAKLQRFCYRTEDIVIWRKYLRERCAEHQRRCVTTWKILLDCDVAPEKRLYQIVRG